MGQAQGAGLVQQKGQKRWFCPPARLHAYIRHSILIPTHLPVYIQLPICLPGHLSTWLSAYLSACLCPQEEQERGGWGDKEGKEGTEEGKGGGQEQGQKGVQEGGTKSVTNRDEGGLRVLGVRQVGEVGEKEKRREGHKQRQLLTTAQLPHG